MDSIITPVFQAKPLYSLKLTDIVCHQSQTQGTGVGGDLGVQGADRCAISLQIGADFPVFQGDAFIEGQNSYS